MNPSVEKLYQIGKKESRLIMGLMAGTSLDGLDIALCRFTGSGLDTRIELLSFETTPFDEDFKMEVRRIFAKKEVDFHHLCMLNPWIGNFHGDLILDCLRKWGIKPSEIDLIASHGQTVMHMPKRLHKLPKFPNATLQIGDGDHLARKTGIITLSDFRQKHCAAGGEGAPLALYGDYLLFGSSEENRVLINIGGIANFTYLPQDGDFSKVFATDTGPGNTLIDAFVQVHFNRPFDENASLALQGRLLPELLKKLLNHEYFSQEIPKTTGPELFNLNYLKQAIGANQYAESDILHTLCHFSAHSLVNEIKKQTDLNLKTTIYLSGGGMHNPLMVSLIKEQIPSVPIENMDILGISGDAKEAVLFAALANETLAGERGFDAPSDTGEQFFMGKISFPL